MAVGELLDRIVGRHASAQAVAPAPAPVISQRYDDSLTVVTTAAPAGPAEALAPSETAELTITTPNALVVARTFSRLRQFLTYINGIVAPEAGSRIIWFYNAATVAITIRHESAEAAEANRIHSITGADFTLAVGDTVGLVYDATSKRWRQFTGPFFPEDSVPASALAEVPPSKVNSAGEPNILLIGEGVTVTGAMGVARVTKFGIRGNGAKTGWVFIHGLGTKYVDVSLQSAAAAGPTEGNAWAAAGATWKAISKEEIEVTFAVAPPGTARYGITVVG